MVLKQNNVRMCFHGSFPDTSAEKLLFKNKWTNCMHILIFVGQVAWHTSKAEPKKHFQHLAILLNVLFYVIYKCQKVAVCKSKSTISLSGHQQLVHLTSHEFFFSHTAALPGTGPIMLSTSCLLFCPAKWWSIHFACIFFSCSEKSLSIVYFFLYQEASDQIPQNKVGISPAPITTEH